MPAFYRVPRTSANCARAEHSRHSWKVSGQMSDISGKLRHVLLGCAGDFGHAERFDVGGGWNGKDGMPARGALNSLGP
ncbi:hypothetical protein QEG98_18505 [Myxococcus sp. MxC21-1]|uniref:hypothetical protein n=1 Tax=Myxococcus sp. MxC21-1 TaxID=3041439 RepID=UPI0029301395|nr:hypothetical protein [Myxococcus sp. MxC21-1]WNZ65439.1 hypothetical protein QEG98_18505 [Myxococcus sp. MxC21-1]